MRETYISVDVEADGPIPGDNSMLSLGAAAFDDSGELVDTFAVNLQPRGGAVQDPETMKFWKKYPHAWAELQVDAMFPEFAMITFATWLLQFESPVFVGYPATFDFGFVHWYFHHYLGRDPFGFQGLDLKTYAMAILGTGFKETTKSAMPREWFKESGQHTHVAVDDAIEQGYLFFRMRESARGMRQVAQAFRDGLRRDAIIRPAGAEMSGHPLCRAGGTESEDCELDGCPATYD